MTTEVLKNLISCRVRLDENQRLTLRNAYNKIREAQTPVQTTPVAPGSSISVNTTYNVNTELGLADITIRDILNSRDSIGLPMLIELQRALNVEVVSKKDIMDSCKSYCDYVFK